MRKQNEEIPTWGTEKKYSFDEIKEFYHKVMLFPKEILEQIIFYGGTTAYIMTQSENVGREFGDVDILVPASKIALVRKYLENTDGFIIQYDGKVVAEDYNIVSSDGIQDFGVKGSLFGIKLSVHPIAETKEGLIISKWIKVNNNKVDLIANVVMLQNSNLIEMFRKVDCDMGTLNIVKPELLIGWKRRRMDSHDEQDIKFMYENKEILEIEENNINRFLSKMPSCDVSKAYKITSSGIIELGSGKYEDF